MKDVPTTSDGSVAAAVLAGDVDQFELLVRRYYRPLLRVAESRLGRREWAEDIVQETFLNAFKSLKTYDSQYSFRTWLWTILLNQCRRALTKQARRASKAAPAATEEQWEQHLVDPNRATPLTVAVANDQAERLNQHLDLLTPDQADALRLRFFGGLKFQEIAAAMGCSLSTAKNRVRSGLEQMAERLTNGNLGEAGAADPSTKKPTRENPS